MQKKLKHDFPTGKKMSHLRGEMRAVKWSEAERRPRSTLKTFMSNFISRCADLWLRCTRVRRKRAEENPEKSSSEILEKISELWSPGYVRPAKRRRGDVLWASHNFQLEGKKEVRISSFSRLFAWEYWISGVQQAKSWETFPSYPFCFIDVKLSLIILQWSCINSFNYTLIYSRPLFSSVLANRRYIKINSLHPFSSYFFQLIKIFRNDCF